MNYRSFIKYTVKSSHIHLSIETSAHAEYGRSTPSPLGAAIQKELLRDAEVLANSLRHIVKIYDNDGRLVQRFCPNGCKATGEWCVHEPPVLVPELVRPLQSAPMTERYDFAEKKHFASQLSFETLRKANIARLPQFKNKQGEPCHPPDGSGDWTPAQWLQAMIGELGEYANLQKKIERGDFSYVELEKVRKDLAHELADVMIYFDLLCNCLDMDLGTAVVEKFNIVSERVKSSIRLEGKAGQGVVAIDTAAPLYEPPSGSEQWNAG